MTMDTPIVIGGLINQHTGEVIETAENGKQMLALRLKARELNGDPWRPRQEFGFFEFTSALGWDSAFLKRNMLVPIPDQVFAWHKAYMAKMDEGRVETMQVELAAMEEARSAMSTAPGFYHFEHLIDAEINEVRDSLTSLQQKLSRNRLRSAERQGAGNG